jgi:hypothetical protein
MDKFSLNIFRLFFIAMSIFMIGLVIQTSLKSNFFEVLPALNAQPWFTTTIVDFYFNITIISAWVIYKEANIIKSFLWITGFVLLGSIATAFYVFLQLAKLKPGDQFYKALLRG